MPEVVDPGQTEVAWFGDEGVYRTVTQRTETGTVGGIDVTVEIVEEGDLVVWIDEAPEDREDGSGRFEVYEPDVHGDDYQPSVTDAVEEG